MLKIEYCLSITSVQGTIQNRKFSKRKLNKQSYFEADVNAYLLMTIKPLAFLICNGKLAVFEVFAVGSLVKKCFLLKQTYCSNVLQRYVLHCGIYDRIMVLFRPHCRCFSLSHSITYDAANRLF